MGNAGGRQGGGRCTVSFCTPRRTRLFRPHRTRSFPFQYKSSEKIGRGEPDKSLRRLPSRLPTPPLTHLLGPTDPRGRFASAEPEEQEQRGVPAAPWVAAVAAAERRRGRPVGEGVAGGSASRAFPARGPRPRRTCLRAREWGEEGRRGWPEVVLFPRSPSTGTNDTKKMSRMFRQGGRTLNTSLACRPNRHSNAGRTGTQTRFAVRVPATPYRNLIGLDSTLQAGRTTSTSTGQ